MVISEKFLFACIMVGVFITCILFVVFGQITVRKLRKNPKTKAALGIEFVSGWDIINAAQALALPKKWTKTLERSPISSLHAKSECLRENTTRFDRGLAFVFYWLYVSSGLSLILLVVLDGIGVFD